jgi:hypothetical protein
MLNVIHQHQEFYRKRALDVEQDVDDFLLQMEEKHY